MRMKQELRLRAHAGMLVRRVKSRAAATILITTTLLLLAGAARAQISPGPLSRAHQFLSGPTQCTTCHRFGAGAPSFKCVDCHVEIARRLAEHRGFHAVLAKPENNGRDCAQCHSEHNGENFQLIHWEPSLEAFDHAKTGYVLEGKHAGLACNKCHVPEHVSEAERRAIQMKDLRGTYLGLSRDCRSCHTDPHRGQLGPNCSQCHNVLDWKQTSQFDHSKTRFSLTGAHARVACAKCHTPSGPGGAVRFAGVPFDKCTDCHTDPHRGAFPQRCESCHNTSAWKQVQLAGKFDHSKTDYPLLGKHAQVGCVHCHHSGDFKKPLAFQKCSDCHTPDPHGGQFLDRAECSACHTVEGFKPARFGLPEHAATRYPLEGRHAQVACAKCHQPSGIATRYKIPFARCTDCHTDAHRGQFAAAPDFNRCESCHTVQGFRPSTYTIARHQQSRFPLLEAHVAVACVDCHRADTHQPGATVPYRFADVSCTACHGDPHHGEFMERMRKRGPTGAPLGCEACHSLKSWHDLARFDHATTTFPLVGAHRKVACVNCHRPSPGVASLRNVSFRSAPARCEGCHTDIHGGQFAGQGRFTDCSSCHGLFRWKPSLFNHNVHTRFSLLGAHQRVPCAGCHKTTRIVQGKPVLFYKPTPRQCKDCHGAT